MARPGLSKNVKFKKLVKTLGIPKPFVLGLLETLWEVGYESGNPIIGNPEDVEIAAEWPENDEYVTGKLFEALRNCRWIDSVAGTDDLWEIHDLLENAPDYVRKRASRLNSSKTKDLRSVSSADVRHLVDIVRHCPPSPPSPPPQKKEEEASSCSEPAQGRPASKPPEQPVLVFEIVGGKKSWNFTKAKLAEYEESFPHLNILGECLKARQWLRENRAKRKTARGMGRFLYGWMSRAQNNGQGKEVPIDPNEPRVDDDGIPNVVLTTLLQKKREEKSHA